MRIECECNVCKSCYTVAFTELVSSIDWPDDCENGDDTDQSSYPEFCPFCGAHEALEEGDLEED